jgi:hypothetical protein
VRVITVEAVFAPTLLMKRVPPLTVRLGRE